MTLKDALAQLKSLGDEKVRARNRKNGAGDNQYGVQMGDIRKLAAKIKTDHQLAMALWDTGNIDARLLNNCLAGIGIHFPKLRKRALAIGESLGIYRDYPVSKGCTSPFAPIWINEIVRRNGD